MPFADLLSRKSLTTAALVAALGFGAASSAGAKTLFPDLTPQVEERVVCSIAAAAKYEIPANIVLAVAEKEAGKPGQWVKNSNETYDVGVMQFNTTYLSDLAKYGISAQDVAAAGCYPYDLAAWRLRGHIRNDKGDLWKRAANYHSKTEQYNAIYRADLKVKAEKWATWLDQRFITVNYEAGSPAKQATQTASLAASSTAEKPAMQARPSMRSNMTRTSFRSSGYVPRQLIMNNEP
ncbi:TPA: transglycosylase SLT domain-containing protein [Escherichia coli]